MKKKELQSIDPNTLLNGIESARKELKKELLASNLSRRQLAAKTGLNENQIDRMVNGGYAPKAETVISALINLKQS